MSLHQLAIKTTLDLSYEVRKLWKVRERLEVAKIVTETLVGKPMFGYRLASQIPFT